MFEGLNQLTTAMAVNKVKRLRMTRQLLHAQTTLWRYNTTRLTLKKSLEAMMAVVDDFRDVRRLHAVVGTEGLNRALVAFVNPKKRGLSKVVGGLPAVESLDTIILRTTDPRVQTVLIGLQTALATESALVADWVRGSADSLGRLLDRSLPVIEDLSDAVTHYLSELEDATVSDDDLAATTVVLIPQAVVSACLTAILETLPNIETDIADPTDQDAMDIQKQSFAARSETVGVHVGIAVDSDNAYQLQPQDNDACAPVEASLFELGYTLSATQDLLRCTDAVLDAVREAISRKDELLGPMLQAATLLEAIDNDVPPAASLGDDNDSTQVDLVYTQASSHAITISSLLDCVIDKVQCVLTAAQMIDELDQSDTFDPTTFDDDYSDDDAPDEDVQDAQQGTVDV